MATITIDDKVQYQANALPDINKWTAADINHFKSVINANAVVEASPDVSGGSIDLPLTNQEIIFNLGNLSGAKTFTFSGSEAKKFNIKLPITGIGALTFPASVVMSDSRWNGTAWTPDEIGTYYGKAYLVGANWYLEIPQIPSV
jgi:hypothetical protein